ncbi:MAG: ComEC/Rec2 family competence protein [Spirochaetales bacterium]
MDTIRVRARLSPAEWTACISAAVFYGLRHLPAGFDFAATLAAITGIASLAILVRRRRRVAAITAGILVCGILSGAIASSRVRRYEMPPHLGLESLEHTDSQNAVTLSLRAADDARRAPTGEFQLWARVYRICDENACVSANARAFVRDRRLPAVIAGTPLRIVGTVEVAGDIVFVRATSDSKAIAALEYEKPSTPADYVRALRASMTRVFRDRVSHWPAELRGVFAALFAGDRTDLPYMTERLMREAGAAHILALSGMHLGILAGSIYFVSKRLMSPPAARVTVCAFALGYLGFAGLRPSLVRAVVMLCIATVIRARDGTVNLRVVLALSFLVHSVLIPKDLTSLAFGLSFLSLLGLVVLSGGIHSLLPSRIPRILRGGLSAGLAAQTMTAPLVYSVFGVIYPAGIISSILLTPLAVMIIALGGGALAAGPFSGPWLAALGPAVSLLESTARAGARAPSIASVGATAVFMLVIPVLLVIAWVRYRLKLRRWRRYAHEQRLLRFDG